MNNSTLSDLSLSSCKRIIKREWLEWIGLGIHCYSWWIIEWINYQAAAQWRMRTILKVQVQVLIKTWSFIRALPIENWRQSQVWYPHKGGTESHHLSKWSCAALSGGNMLGLICVCKLSGTSSNEVNQMPSLDMTRHDEIPLSNFKPGSRSEASTSSTLPDEVKKSHKCTLKNRINEASNLACFFLKEHLLFCWAYWQSQLRLQGDSRSTWSTPGDHQLLASPSPFAKYVPVNWRNEANRIDRIPEVR